MECTGQPGFNGDTTNMPIWTVSSTPALGFGIYDSTSGALQICTTSGAGGTGTKPTFSATAGVTTTDASATWTSCGAHTNFGAWAAPHARLANAFASTWGAAGNTFFLGDNHAETQATAITQTSPGTMSSPCYIWCVDHTASVPPGGSNLKTAATVTSTGASNMTLTGAHYSYGITYKAGSGANGPQLQLTGSWQVFEACSLQVLGTSTFAGAQEWLTTEYLLLDNTTVAFGGTGDSIYPCDGGTVIWRNTASAIAGSSTPTTLFTTEAAGDIDILGVDLSLITGTLFNSVATAIGSNVYMLDCKLGSGVTIASNMTTNVGFRIEMVNCDSAGDNYRSESWAQQATKTVSTTVTRTGGASDGTTAQSHQIVTTSAATWFNYFRSAPLSQWNTTLSTNRGVTIYGIANSATIPTNAQIWIEAQYMGSASNPLGTFVNNTIANGLTTGSSQTADSTSVWNANAAARQNSHAYSVGNIIAVSTNTANLIFFCTASSGNSAASVPGGYTSATDGQSVTDGSCTFRAGYRFAMVLSLSTPQPAQVGPIVVTVNAGLASTTYFIDPLIVLS